MKPALKELIAGVLNVSADGLTSESGPKTVGEWDSLAHVTIAAAIEQTYGIELSMTEILEITSMGDWERILNERGTSR